MELTVNNFSVLNTIANLFTRRTKVDKPSTKSKLNLTVDQFDVYMRMINNAERAAYKFTFNLMIGGFKKDVFEETRRVLSDNGYNTRRLQFSSNGQELGKVMHEEIKKGCFQAKADFRKNQNHLMDEWKKYVREEA